MAIKNFEQFIIPTLENGNKFISYECKNLLSAGENYGSVMLQIDVKISNAKGEEEIMHCVAKTAPPNEFLWKMFNTPVTFKKELAVYTTIVPALNEFGREKGIDCLIDSIGKCLGARVSLDPNSSEVDRDAVLLMENLKTQGYNSGDRFNGLDLESSKLVLKDLATLQASVIAYKLVKPEEFKTKIRPYLNFAFNVPEDTELMDKIIEDMKRAISTNPECVPHAHLLEKGMRDDRYMTNKLPKADELYATITHNDLWVNNTMQKYENGKPVKNKMVDFQVIEYTSLANDVVFFIYSSVSLSVLESHTDELFKFYYNQFIKTLVNLDSDISDYTFDGFLKELGTVAGQAQYQHVTFMLTPMMKLKEKAKELAEFEPNELILEESALHENYYKKIQFVLLDFVKRGWLK